MVFEFDKNRILEAESFYLDYLNNFLTVQAIADHYEISKAKALILIDRGREENKIRAGVRNIKAELKSILNGGKW